MNTVATVISNLGPQLPSVGGIIKFFAFSIGIMLVVIGLYGLMQGSHRTAHPDGRPQGPHIATIIAGSFFMQADALVTAIQSMFYGDSGMQSPEAALSYHPPSSGGMGGLVCMGTTMASVIGLIFVYVGIGKLRRSASPGGANADMFWKGVTHLIFGSLLLNFPQAYAIVQGLFNMAPMSC